MEYPLFLMATARMCIQLHATTLHPRIVSDSTVCLPIAAAVPASGVAPAAMS